MSSLAIQYYSKRFEGEKSRAFIHLAREIGELARGMEQNNSELVKLELTEAAALLHYMASLYGFDLDENIGAVYKKKLETAGPR